MTSALKKPRSARMTLQINVRLETIIESLEHVDARLAEVAYLRALGAIQQFCAEHDFDIIGDSCNASFSSRRGGP